MSNDAKKYQDELQNILKKAQNAMQELKDSVGQEMKSMKNEPQSNLSEKKVFFSFASQAAVSSWCHSSCCSIRRRDPISSRASRWRSSFSILSRDRSPTGG